MLLLLHIIKFFSLSINSRTLHSYMLLFNDFLFSVFIFMLTILLVVSEKDIIRIAKIFFYGYSMVLVLVVIESVFKTPIYALLSSINLSNDPTLGKIRGGGYRVQGSFEAPLILAQYLVVLFPIILAYMIQNKFIFIWKIIYFILFFYAIYVTGSRSPFLMFMIVVYLYIFLSLYKSNPLISFMTQLINTIFVVIALYVVYNYVTDLISSFGGHYYLITDEEQRSSMSRALQYISVFSKIIEAPFLGFGKMGNYLILFDDLLTVDNYYFWLMLEVGFIGLSVYILFLLLTIKTALHQYKLPNKNYYLLPILISMIVFTLYQLLLTSYENHIYLYIFAGLISIMKVLQNEQEKHKQRI